MIRKKVLLDNKYDKKFEPAEDYELWTRLSKIGKLANLNEILLLYREHNGQISITKNLIQKQHNFACNLKMLNQLCIMDSFDENQIKLAIKPENNNLEDFKIANNFFTFLVQKNNLENVFNPILFKNKVSRIKLHFLKVFLKQDKIKRIFFLAFNISLIDLFKAMEIKESLAKIIRYKN